MKRLLHYSIQFAPALFWFFLSCNSPLSGGNSSETTNVAIVTQNGEPAEFAKVTFVHSDWISKTLQGISPVIDTVKADDRGTITTGLFPEEVYNIQIDHHNSTLFIPDFSVEGKVLDTLFLQKSASLSGAVGHSDTVSASIHLTGTSYKSSICSEGTYLFENISPRSYSLVAKSDDGRATIIGSQLLEAGARVEAREVPLSFSGFLLDDFEDGNTKSALGEFTGGFWYSFMDTILGGNSQLQWSVEPDEDGYALKSEIALDTTPDAWAGIGLGLSDCGFEFDLTALESISFRAKGTGTVRLSIESSTVDSISHWPHFGYTIDLQPQWVKYTITADSLGVLKNTEVWDSGITWKQAAQRITRIEFEASGYYSETPLIEFWIDDLRIEGVTLEEILLQMENQ
ncbi:hypothetical protein QA601_15090 [Chitinispirillales bacterium ANBcel5]|uniref:hypothetical protein n=1 Tax=Cellulosispirillum alkaliphilum TaxID=3039283 RepID=UPI002A58811A|nr:hypothetical protein [Chitinispirillales bacterium ANBcel5]